jgi:hypothetical protein
MLLEEADGKELAQILHAPELAAEVERAVGQVKQMLNIEKNPGEEKLGTDGSKKYGRQ